MTQEKIDGMVGRFIHGTNRERDAFVDEVRVEIKRQQRRIDTLEGLLGEAGIAVPDDDG